MQMQKLVMHPLLHVLVAVHNKLKFNKNYLKNIFYY